MAIPFTQPRSECGAFPSALPFRVPAVSSERGTSLPRDRVCSSIRSHLSPAPAGLFSVPVLVANMGKIAPVLIHPVISMPRSGRPLRYPPFFSRHITGRPLPLELRPIGTATRAAARRMAR